MKASSFLRFSYPAMLASGASLLLVSLQANPAMAHGAERGLVMLLPTGYTLLGGALAVAVSFLLLAVVPDRWFANIDNRHIVLMPATDLPKAPVSLLSFLLLGGCVASGFFGPADPLSNPLPLLIWTVLWVGFTLVQVLLGNLWPWLNPWSGPLALLRQVTGSDLGQRGRIVLPKAIGYLPAIILFALFAWFELISLAPEDPPRLAWAVSLYWLVNLAAMLLFGEAEWMKRGEPFCVFFRMIGMLSPFAVIEKNGRNLLALTWLGRRCLNAEALPPSATFLILLTLGTASFDGFSETFTWLGFIGINPLEFPGRSGVTLPNSLGLASAPLLLGLLFYGAILAGDRLAGGRLGEGRQTGTVQALTGHLIYSIIPISIAFHGAHYLTLMLINSQHVLVMLSDPFSLGWDLFGTADMHVTASFLQHLDGVRLIWTAQTLIIVIGHVTGIVLAHLVALRHYPTAGRAALSQLFLATVMVFYTVFGLWLLSTPSAG